MCVGFQTLRVCTHTYVYTYNVHIGVYVGIVRGSIYEHTHIG